MELVDLGPCEGTYFEGDPQRIAVVLPGARYGPDGPLLWFAREAAQARGWSVLQVWDTFDREQFPETWVADRFKAAMSYVGEGMQRLVITKSLTSLALPAMVDADLASICFTPLLAREEVRTALETARAPTLILGATGDSTWDSEFVAGLNHVEVLQVDGSNHVLTEPGDPFRSLEYLQTATEKVLEFLDQIALSQ